MTGKSALRHQLFQAVKVLFLQEVLNTLLAGGSPRPCLFENNGSIMSDQFLTLTGKGGVSNFVGGLAFSCCTITSMVFSSCGSLFCITASGHCSTSISG